MATIQRPDDNDAIRQIGEMWDAAKVEFDRLRELAEQAASMGKLQSALTAAKTDREAALMKLGEAFYKIAGNGQMSIPPELKRAIGEVKAKDAELIRQQADIAAILKEADALAERAKKAAPARKKPVKA